MRTLISGALICIAAVAANADWSYEILWDDGTASAIDGNVIGGWESYYGHGGTYYTRGYLLGFGAPGGYGYPYEYAVITGVHGTQQVGMQGGGTYRAVLWNGSPASAVSLHPAGWGESGLADVYAGRQVGYVLNLDTGINHAGIWSGTSASFIDLNPSGYTYSHANGIFEDIQVGDADAHAGLWRGTAASFVDLHPVGFVGSWAYDVSENQQVGRVSATWGIGNAALWYGMASSFVNLHPGAATESSAGGVTAGQQVGEVDDRAAYWTGSASSYLDLHSYLPAGFAYSSAYDIWDNGDVTRVVGGATDASGNYAVAWTRVNTSIPVSVLNVVRGLVVAGGLASIGESDDIKLRIRPGIVFSSLQSRILIQVDGTSPNLNPGMLSLFIESGTSGGDAIEQMVRMYDFDANAYETIELRMMSIADKTVRLNVTDDPGRFVGPSGQVRAIMGYRALGPVFVNPWELYVDRVRWVVPGT